MGIRILISALFALVCSVSAQAENLVLPKSENLSGSNTVAGLEVFQSLPREFVRPIPIPSGARGKSITLSKIVLDVKLHEVAGKKCTFLGMGNGRMTLGQVNSIQTWFYPEIFKNDFVNILGSAGYDVAQPADDLFDRQGEARETDYVVAGRIIEVLAEYCSQYDPERQRHYVTRIGGGLIIEWQVLDTKTETVVLKTVSFGADRANLSRGEYLRTAMQNSFRLAAWDLMGERRFYRLVFGDILDKWDEAMTPIGIGGTAFDSEAKPQSRLLAKSLVVVESEHGKTDGFVLSSEGYILTSASELGLSRDVKVQIGRSRKKVDGVVLRLSPLDDVALIRITPPEKTALIPLPLRRAPATSGEKVNILKDGRNTGSKVQKRSGVITGRHDKEPGRTILTTDIRHRNTIQGTPLLDQNGNVLGMKIRDFTLEQTTEKESLFLTIHDALNALRIFAVSDEAAGVPAVAN